MKIFQQFSEDFFFFFPCILQKFYKLPGRSSGKNGHNLHMPHMPVLCVLNCQKPPSQLTKSYFRLLLQYTQLNKAGFRTQFFHQMINGDKELQMFTSFFNMIISYLQVALLNLTCQQTFLLLSLFFFCLCNSPWEVCFGL